MIFNIIDVPIVTLNQPLCSVILVSFFYASFVIKSCMNRKLISSIKDTAAENIELSPNIPSEANFALRNIDSDNFLVSFIASNLSITLPEKQHILNSKTLKERANMVFEHLIRENQMLKLKDLML